MPTPAIQTFGTSISFAGVPIGYVQDITGPGESAESVDITNHDSEEAYREKIPVILDGGENTFDIIYTGAAGQQALRTAFLGRVTDEVVVEWPDGTTATYDGFVSTWNWATPVAGVLKASIGITVSGPVDLVDAGS